MCQSLAHHCSVNHYEIYFTIQHDLAARSRMLLLAVKESAVDMQGSKSIEFADEVEA